MWELVLFGGLISVVALLVVSKFRYCKRLFSTESFREFHRELSNAIETAQRKAPDQPPSGDDGTAFVTHSGLAVAVTAENGAEGNQTIHISLSQAGRVTTHSVCSRFAFFAVAMFRGVNLELVPYYTDSGVHHLLFRLRGPAVHLQDFDSTYPRWAKDYRPIPFRHEKLESSPSKPVGRSGGPQGPPSMS
jgi:hypothetical protein